MFKNHVTANNNHVPTQVCSNPLNILHLNKLIFLDVSINYLFHSYSIIWFPKNVFDNLGYFIIKTIIGKCFLRKKRMNGYLTKKLFSINTLTTVIA